MALVVFHRPAQIAIDPGAAEARRDLRTLSSQDGKSPPQPRKPLRSRRLVFTGQDADGYSWPPLASSLGLRGTLPRVYHPILALNASSADIHAALSKCHGKNRSPSTCWRAAPADL